MIFWGDLHNHCGITYGFGTLENALKIARSHLDFCAVTGHAMWPDIFEDDPELAFVIKYHKEGFEKLRSAWTSIRDTIASHNRDDFVTFQSYEMHSRYYGDYHILSPDDSLDLIYRDSPQELVDGCGCDAIAIPHHIGYTPNYRGISWDRFNERISPCVEVISKHGCAMSNMSPYRYYHTMGPLDPGNTVYQGMKCKYRFSFLGSTDHHAGFPGSYGDGLTAVIAKDKSRASIWEALKSGKTYAVSGDRIECDFTINGADIGSTIRSNSRLIKCDALCEFWLDKIVIYKNNQPLDTLCGEDIGRRQVSQYKLRLEVGWGSSEDLYKWDCAVSVDGGQIIKSNVYFRGRSILAPTNENKNTSIVVNDIDNYVVENNHENFRWVCETVKNITTLHPQTDSGVITIEGNDDTKVTISVNNEIQTKTIKELLEAGYSQHMKYYSSHAYLVHTLIPQYGYDVTIEFLDSSPNTELDIYHAEIFQKNGQVAYISPIYAKEQK